MIGKKLTYIVVSILFLVLNLVMHVILDFSQGIWSLIFIAAYIVFALNFLEKLELEESSSNEKQVFIAVYFLAVSNFLFFFPALGVTAKIFFIFMTSALSYFLLLAINVYGVIERRGEIIPLLQPAKMVVFIAFVMVIFLGSTEIYKFLFFINYPLINLAIKICFFAAFYFVMIFFSEWFLFGPTIKGEGDAGEQANQYRIGRSTPNSRDENSLKVLSVWVLFITAVFINFFPFEDFGRAVLLAAVSYVLVNYTQNYISHKLTDKFLLGSALLLGFVYLTVLFL